MLRNPDLNQIQQSTRQQMNQIQQSTKQQKESDTTKHQTNKIDDNDQKDKR